MKRNPYDEITELVEPVLKHEIMSMNSFLLGASWLQSGRAGGRGPPPLRRGRRLRGGTLPATGARFNILFKHF